MGDSNSRFLVGMDVGSTTVKAVVVDSSGGKTLWHDYQRHETRQPEKVLEFLQRMEKDLQINPGNCRIFVTGSGGGALAGLIGARFVQEVHAVSLAVETLHPEAYSVVELGGQDAKIIVFRDGEEGGRKKKIPSMNDKCAGGTGAVIDKIGAKLKIPPGSLRDMGYAGLKVHHVAGKCGVFAETDINGLQKQGIATDELMASLFDAIVLQNLTVLTRGHTLHPHVLLLGGPNTFIRGMQEAWQHNIPLMWEERRLQLPDGVDPADLIRVPDDAQYFGAIGAVEFGREESLESGKYTGTECLVHYLEVGRQKEKARCGTRGLVASAEELLEFEKSFALPDFTPARFEAGTRVRGFVGVDGGSTSTKAVLLAETGEVLCKAYQLSRGNPIQDTVDMFEALRGHVESQGAGLEVLGVVTTGYAKDILRDALGADTALVETVAHTQSALRYFDDPQVILDVGGQDIKIMILRNGRVKDFRLNTQCSAGNGYFLQSTAEGFGIPVERYAEAAFSAQSMPVFGFGCAVFLQSDIVNFQRHGWQSHEVLAGLAAVLPKNIFLYVAGIPNVAKLGSRFVLQGGTQKNLAAVKAQVDFIRSHFSGAGGGPEIHVHPHCAESGAIGAAVEARRLWQEGRKTTFIGLDAVRNITYRTTRNEDTRCHFCKNACLRTFIDIQTGVPHTVCADAAESKVPLYPGEQRLIIATCEKGAVETLDAMREVKAGLDAIKAANPNFVEIAARDVWKRREIARVADPLAPLAWTRAARERTALARRRGDLRIGIPRVLNLYTYAPLFSAYLQSLGVLAENIVYSDFTTSEMYRTGSSRGAIDPCFPSKIAIAHMHNLIYAKHARRPLDCIFFPMFDVLPSNLVKTVGRNACPTTAATPQTVKAAYTKEVDVFAEQDILYVHPLVNLSDRALLARQMLQAWAPVLGISDVENERALLAGFQALAEHEASLRRKARETLDTLEREERLGIVILGRSYHHDPGVNHGIPEQFQKLGYPVFSQNTLPVDEDLLERLFGDEVRAGVISHPLDISDVWKNSLSASSNNKLWAAKFVARHPNLVALELSSFKCGHDAPVYSVVEEIVERSGTPYFCFKDLDENRPQSSIRIRVETIDYFLRRYREEIVERNAARRKVDTLLADYERRLRGSAAFPEARAAGARKAGPAELRPRHCEQPGPA